MSMYLGDYAEDATLDFMWSTNNGDGASITRSTNGTVSVYKGNSTTQSTAGVTDTEDFDSLTGIHHCRIDLSADVFYAVGYDYMVVLSAATIDGQTVNAVLACFSIENRVVKSVKGNVTGSVASVSGAVGSVTGNVGGNVAGSVASVTGAVGSVTGNVGGNVVGSVASVTGAVGSVTGNVGGNVTGSVASVTGAVGSVTGAVGSVTGAVGSVTAGVTLANDAITSAKFDETTAFPITSVDSGATRVARTGADGDTLKTLSDEIAALNNLSAAAAADAVWDELLSGHTGAGTAGKALSDAGGASSPSAIADAVWDEATAGHTTVATFGAILAGAIAELTGVPSATPTLLQAIMLSYMAIRNNPTSGGVPGSEMRKYRNAAGTVIAQASETYDGQTFSGGQLATPP